MFQGTKVPLCGIEKTCDIPIESTCNHFSPLSAKNRVSVSIIAPNYNNGKYLQDFIQSVIASTILPDELIIIDDGSTDESADVLDRFRGNVFLKVIRFSYNQGLPAVLNAGLEAATAKYIMRADPDDLLHPERIERQYRFMEEHPGVDVLGCNVTYFNGPGRRMINSSNFPVTHCKIANTYKRGEHGLMHATAFLRGEVYRKYRYQPIFPGEDYELFSRMARDGYTFQNLPESLYFVRIHPDSSTNNLKMEAIRQTFAFRDSIFGTKTNPLWIHMYYQHIKHYRCYQMSEKRFNKYPHLLISGLLYPAKICKRALKVLKHHT